MLERDDNLSCGESDNLIIHVAKHIWRRLTKTFLKSPIDPPLIGIFNNTAIYLLLDTLSFRNLSKFNFDGEKIIFAESCLIGSDELKEQKINFKHLPRNI
ncbi:MAG: hypothetical protein IJ728_07820 [Selenomonadaceae bacterium]|nr:hypothetical protein [Selenomonadaceae bacterium]